MLHNHHGCVLFARARLCNNLSMPKINLIFFIFAFVNIPLRFTLNFGHMTNWITLFFHLFNFLASLNQFNFLQNFTHFH